jgi:hypothetical protein
MGFFAPSALQARRVGVMHRFHPMRLPSSAFLRPSRVSSSTRPVALFHATRAHGVSALQSFSLLANSTRLVTGRYPLGVSLRSEDAKPHPQGFMSARSPFPGLGVFHPRPGRCSPGLRSASAAFCEPGWPRHSTRHPLSTFATGAFTLAPEGVLSVFPQVHRMTTLSGVPAALAFSGLLFAGIRGYRRE